MKEFLDLDKIANRAGFDTFLEFVDYYKEDIKYIEDSICNNLSIWVQSKLKEQRQICADNAETKNEISYDVNEIYDYRVIDKDSILNAPTPEI